ncbi:MAG: carboxypeptidase-like regulatory domain-containing protein, partial [Saprospiraceae bacterium]
KNIEIHDKPYVEPLILRQVRAAFKNVKYVVNNGKTKYQIEGQDSTMYRHIFINQQTNRPYFYVGSMNYFRNIPVGNYKMYGYTPWGNYFTHDVEILKDTMIYEYLDNQIYQKDENLTFLKSLVSLKDIIVPETPKIGQNNTTKPITKPLKQTNYSGPTYPISGTITDESGEGLIGCSIILKGTTIGTVTGLDGEYTIQIPESIANPILLVSYLGYTTEQVSISGNDNYNIAMGESEDVLEEVVVVGYSSVLKSESVATMKITKDEIQRLPSRDIDQLIGTTAGVMAEGETAEMLRDNRRVPTDYYIDGIKVTDSLMISDLKANSKIRSRFSDYAFFEPNLITDRKGEATFRVTYPDDITSYQTFVVGMDRRHNFGIATKTVQSQKMALAQLSIPRFMVIGDKANVIGKSLNYSNDSLKIKSSFLLDDKVLKTNNFWLENAEIETAEIVANTDNDTLMLTYKMEHSKFFDGEKRPIPIYRKGVEETVGSFNILHSDTSLTLNFESDKGNVKMYARTDVLEVLLQDVQYLIDYPYGCNEQTASRLLALLMDKQIKAALGQKPSKDELIMKMVKRLEKAQNPDGSWGWWTGNSANQWMTNYVLKALYAADTSGYKTPSYEIGLRFITNSLENIQPYQLLNSMELLSDIGQNMDYEKHLKKIDSVISYKDYYNQLRLIKIKQQQGLDYNLLVLDSLENQTLFGNVFYDIDRKRPTYYRYYYWYSNHYNLTNLAYQVLRNETVKQNGEYDYKLAAIRGYFLEKRTRYGWRNTFTTAQILSTILPDMMNGNRIEKPKLVIKGTSTQTVTEFPFETTFYSNEPIEIEKTGTST